MYTDSIYKCILPSILVGGVMGKFIDRVGYVYGKLTVVKKLDKNASHQIMWECLCQCGNVTNVASCALSTGNTKSCGCSKGYIKHNGSHKSSYNTWRAMRRRCTNPKDKDYSKYGAVGILVCPEWEDYISFVSDMGEPMGNETLDRIDPYGNYEKQNCRWASIVTQNRNKRSTKNSKSGYTGVIYKNKKWYGTLTYQKKKYYSKICASIEEAVMARKQLEGIYWSIKSE